MGFRGMHGFDPAGGETGQEGDAVRARTVRRGAAAVALLTFMAAGIYALWRYEPLRWLMGDGPYYAQTSVSLYYDHDLDLRNQLLGGLVVHGKQIALGRDGEWYPKHPILLPVIGLPFLAAFGVPGLLLMNLVVLSGLAALLFRIAASCAPPRAAAATVAVLAFGSFLPAYAYNLSPDLFAAFLVAAAVLAALERRDAAAGLLLGGAVLAKPLLATLLLPAALYALATSGRRGLLRFLAGGLPAACALGLLNLALFGSPFTTAYDRNVVFQDGVPTIATHRDQFDGDFLAGAVGMLFDPRHGLLPTAPALLLAAPGTLLLARRRPALAAWLAGSAVLLFVSLCSYRPWAMSHYGNRFLMPLVVFATPGVALVLRTLLERRTRTPAAGAEAPALDAAA